VGVSSKNDSRPPLLPRTNADVVVELSKQLDEPLSFFSFPSRILGDFLQEAR